MAAPGQWPHFRQAALQLVGPRLPPAGAQVAPVEPVVGAARPLVEPPVGVRAVEPPVAQPVGTTICWCWCRFARKSGAD